MDISFEDEWAAVRKSTALNRQKGGGKKPLKKQPAKEPYSSGREALS